MNNHKTYRFSKMRKGSLAFLCICFAFTSSAQPLKARIKIDVERTAGEIDSLIYGNFTEHLGRCVYGGIYDPASRHADTAGFRKDVVQATKDLGVSLLRWPGGNFVSGYHWTDGIGPKNLRPKRKDLAWGAIETNQVGTDEFLRYCERYKLNPYISVNLGTGTIEEARAWVEYCNANDSTYYATLRTKNGHSKPYGVKIWGLGNEMDGEWQMGYKNAEDYSKTALEAAKLMRWTDGNIKLIACGSSNWWSGDWLGWNRTVLNRLRDQIDYLTLHYYTGNPDKKHYDFMTSLVDLEEKIKITASTIAEVRKAHNIRKPIYVALDEWNVWYKANAGNNYEERYNLQDALVVAQYLNCMVRNAATVKLANMAQLVNVLAPMLVKNDTVIRQPSFYPLSLFAQHCYGTAVQAFLDCPTFTARNANHPYLDVSAAYDAKTKKLVLNVVNRHEEQSIATAITNQFGQLGKAITAYEVNSFGLYDENTAEQQKVKVVERRLNASAEGMTYTFPAHSYTMIVATLK